MKTREKSLSLDNILGLISNNIFSFVLIIGLVYLVDYRNVFGGSNEVYYVISTALFLFALTILIYKYKNPLQYYPHYVSFVKDRNDSMVKMEPFMDPLITKLGLIKPEEFVNVRYSLYPDLGVGIDLDPNTGHITGYPIELGNHTSEIKMKYLGGAHSAKVRLEVIDTLREKTVRVSDDLAPPRTVAQFLVREEDLKIREKELNSGLDGRIRDLEEKYSLKESNLEKSFKSDKENHQKTLASTKRSYEKELKEKDNAHEKELRDKSDSHEKELKDRDDTIDKLETEMTRALQDKEREFVEFEKETKLKFEEKKRELEESYKVEEEPEEEVVEEEPVEEEPEEEVVEEEPVEEEPEEEEEPVEEEPEEPNYDSMTVPQLKKLLKEKGLPVSGKKVDLISRLEN